MKRLLWFVLAMGLYVSSAAASTDPTVLTQQVPSYSGLRIDREWVPKDTPKTIGAPTAWANNPIPDNVAVDTTVDSRWPRPFNEQVPLEIQAFAGVGGSNTWINRNAYSPQFYIVPASQPLRAIRYCRTYNATTHACSVPNWAIGNARMLAGLSADGLTDLHGGVAVPDGVTDGAPGTDGEIVIYQPGWSMPTNSAGPHIGREWELWQFHLNPDFDTTKPESGFNPRFQAASGGRWAPMNISNLASANRWWQSGMYYPSQPGHPNSENENTGWKVTGAGLQLINDVVSSEDCTLGSINHAIGLELPRTRYPAGGYRWPATTSDGNDSSKAVTEGMRLRFPRTLAIPAGLTRLGRLIFKAVQEFGFIVDDQTNSSTVVRVQLNSLQCLALYDGLSPGAQINRFPFNQLILLK